MMVEDGDDDDDDDAKDAVEDDDVKGEENDDVENDDVEEEEDDDVEDADVEEEEDRSQDRDPQFVRAFPVEMHLDVSQEQLYMEIYSRRPNPRRRVGASLPSWNAHGLTRAILEQFCMEIYRKKGGKPEWTPRSNTSLTSCRKTPSVWTYCLGNIYIYYIYI